MTIDIDAIEMRVKAATPGPWTTGADKKWSDVFPPWALVINGTHPLIELESGPQGTADAEFIAHARTDVPALLAKVAELTAERDAALAAVRDALAELEDRTAEARGAREDYEQLRGINAELAAARDAARPVVEAAKAWRSSGETGGIQRRAVADLIAAVDALPKTEVAS